jgi:serine/threonine protein kinase
MASYHYDPRPIAVGGEKAVCRGTCVETGLDVVIKFLKRPYSLMEKQRFAQEIQRLQVANASAAGRVAVLIEFNLDWDPPFYVEEFFPEGTLAKKMQEFFAVGNVFQVGAALGYCRQILVALAEIHDGNQIHRDLKPANVMVRDKKLFINDMGIGRTLDRPTTLQTRAFCGTRGYAAPEQELGRRVDATADIYAVGVILHEMLTGSRGAYNSIIYSGDHRVLRLLHGLLALDPRARFQSARQAADFISSLGLATR